MRIVVFGPDQRVGVWIGDRVVDVNLATTFWFAAQGRSQAVELAASIAPPTLEDFIAAGPSAIEAAERSVEFVASEGAHPDFVHDIDAVRLRAPWPGRRIACAGGNFADHLLGMVRHLPGREQDTLASVAGQARQSGQWGFWKVSHEVAGPGDDVAMPARATYFDYEGEIGIVISKRGKNIRAAAVDSYIWGVTLINDWSIRDRSPSPNRAMSYNLNKNFDRSTSMGPCIVVGELDCQDVEVITRINGDVRQDFNTSGMIFGFGEILEHLSSDFTFVPGDVVAGGTGAGTAADSTAPDAAGERSLERFLKPGDLVEVSSPAIGTLANTIVRSEPAPAGD